MDLDLIAALVSKLESAASGPPGAATIGFDGFTDTIVRVVRAQEPGQRPVHFSSKREFGEELVKLGTDSSSFDLTSVATKMGGNAPITAHALGRLGVRVNCIGMLGQPALHPLFDDMDANCTLYSYAEPTQTTALEFADGKVLLASTAILKTADWSAVCDAIGRERLISIYRDSDIIGFANWGEIEHATEIWEGIEREILPATGTDRRRIAIFDLADPSRRNRDFERLAALIGRLSEAHETVLCLNRNESLALGNHYRVAPDTNRRDLGAMLHHYLSVETLIIRDPHEAVAWTRDGSVSISTFHTPMPRISTGGGDNFNAGYCFARLMGFEVRTALTVAAAVAGHYVATAESPTLGDLIDFLRQYTARMSERPHPQVAQ